MDMTKMFNGMFGKIGPGMCRVSMNGDIAIRTSNGFKTYNPNTNVAVNCDNFALDVGEDWFFIIPTNKVQKGDIIVAGGRPRCVISVRDNTIETYCYEDGTISNIVPEHHMFLGKQYFYGKIVSLFSNMANGKGGMGNIMKYMVMSEMMKSGNNGLGNMSNMLPMMMMMNSGSFNFDFMNDMFNEDEPAETEKTEEA